MDKLVVFAKIGNDVKKTMIPILVNMTFLLGRKLVGNQLNSFILVTSVSAFYPPL
jgi:hypothetical protein